MCLRKKIKNIVGKLIELIERVELKKSDLDEHDISKKILDTQILKNTSILTDTGFSNITHIHKTQPYTVYELTLENGLKLECADNHIIFKCDYTSERDIRSELSEVFVKDLKINDSIYTKQGISKVSSIAKMPYKLCMYDTTVKNENHRYYTNDILSHNTTTTVAFLAWYLCFHVDRNCAVMANKQDTAIEIMNKLTDVFRGLPFFLKPGIIAQGKKGMKFDNGCMIMSSATTKTASIGFTIHVLYLDEAAHVNPTIMGDLWRSVYPTLSSSKISQCIVSSTPNGMQNKFFELWDQAQKGNKTGDDFVPIRVDWWKVPGHDDNWAQQMRKTFGDAEFEQEFALSFNVSSRVLLGSQILKLYDKIKKEFIWKKIHSFKIEEELYENLTWLPGFDVNDVIKNDPTRRFILSIDTGEGKDEDETKENDYNVSNIFEVKLKSIAKMRKILPSERKIENMFTIKQIGIYRDNIADEEYCAKVSNNIVFNLLGEEVTKVNIEMNFNGKNFTTIFKEHDNYYEDIFVKTYHAKPIPGETGKKKIGYKTNSNKDFYCKEAKKYIEKEHKIILQEKTTISEIGSFGKDQRGKYKGLGCKDDISITVIMLSRFLELPEYSMWLEEFMESLPNSNEKNYASFLLNSYVDPNDETSISMDLYNEDSYNMLENIQKQLIFNNQKTSYRYRGY